MIESRGHHFMCTLGFQGCGYSPDFVNNYKEAASDLRANLRTKIKVVDGLDVICRACPNQVGQGKCVKQTQVLKHDKRHMQVLGLRIGQVVMWSEALQLIKKKMSVKKFEYTCEGCS